MNTANQRLKSISSLSSSIVLISIIIIIAILNNNNEQKNHVNAVRTMDFPTVIRRLDCSSFCRRTKFNGYVGGCHCGFTLFSRKRSGGGFQPSTMALEPIQQQQQSSLSPSISYMGNNFGEPQQQQQNDDNDDFNMPLAMLKLSSSPSKMKEYSENLNNNNNDNSNDNKENLNKLYLGER